ncbi:PIN domain-containing protein [Rhodopseudomonas palustris]|uniref:PIN domain-containing protein n=1 Tax=Rhodopseudomonas palustris TaxID=1076 RepID=A0A323UEY2_RHOPL|nr:PIN domain-containing protein [Rhodopseudomonas palustris]PZA10991.1 PIN domain-containing protein [Rhodopseudomonas palustris]
MFANRYTAFIDACSLAGALKRNLLLTLAEGEFFRLRWSSRVLNETEKAISKILLNKGVTDAADRAARARGFMEEAFEEACVHDYDDFLYACKSLPDANDAHVLAAALKTQAATIVTDNLKDFPETILTPLNIEARSTDAFIADTISLDLGRAVAVIRNMRLRLKRPEKTPQILLLDMEAEGLTETVDVLRAHVRSL